MTLRLVISLVSSVSLLVACGDSNHRLGGSSDNIGNVSTGGSSGAGGSSNATEPNGTCAAPFEFPSSDDAWLELEWHASLPALPLPICGTENNPPGSPAVVAKWIAPHDGGYILRAWSNFEAVVVPTRQCGQIWAGPSRPGLDQSGCAMIPPTDLPEPPWDATAIPWSGLSLHGIDSDNNVHVKAGEAYFISLQYLHDVNLPPSPPPDHGTGIVNVTACRPSLPGCL
jgi:hypothetical protein